MQINYKMKELTLETTNSPSWRETIKNKRLDDEVVNLVVDAYTNGINKGYEKAKSFEYKALIKAFQENLEKATTIASDTAEKILEDFAVKLDGLLLKVESKTSFVVAVILPLDFYTSENRRQLTNLLIDLENDNCSDTFSISFTIIPSKESLNLNRLSVDGYILSNEKYQPKRGSKKA